jgi:hypothetical protein
VVGALVMVGGLPVACGASSHTLVLNASASDGLDLAVTYYIDDAPLDEPQEVDATGSWSKTFTVKDPKLITMTADNSDRQGTLSCAIKMDGRIVATHRVNAAHQAATCTPD